MNVHGEMVEWFWLENFEFVCVYAFHYDMRNVRGWEALRVTPIRDIQILWLQRKIIVWWYVCKSDNITSSCTCAVPHNNKQRVLMFTCKAAYTMSDSEIRNYPVRRDLIGKPTVCVYVQLNWKQDCRISKYTLQWLANWWWRRVQSVRSKTNWKP
jgi:hypothetical protein